MVILTSTFSVKMIKGHSTVEITELMSLNDLPEKFDKILSGHDGTSYLFSKITGEDVKTNRTPYTVSSGDVLYVVLPNFRVEVGQELTMEELEDKLSIYKLEIK